MLKRLAPPALFLLLLAAAAAAREAGAGGHPLQKGHTNAVLEVQWSPDDKLLLTYSAGDTYLCVWEMPEGHLRWSVDVWRLVKEKQNEKHSLRAFAWSDDGRFIATGSENGTAQVWDASDGRLVWKSRVAVGYVAGVAFSHDGRVLAATAAPEDEDLRLALFDARGGVKLKEFEGMGGPRFRTFYHDDRLGFSADDKELTVGDRRATVTRWDVESGRLLDKLELSPCGDKRGVDSFSYSRDLSLLAARCGKETVVTDARSGEVVRRHSTAYESKAVVVSRDNGGVASGGPGEFELLNLNSGEEYSLKEQPPIGCGCDFNRDSSLLAFTDYLDDEKVKVVDVKSGRVVARLEAHPGVVRALAFSDDGSLLASGSDDGVVRVWDAAKGGLLRAFEGHTDSVRAVAFGPGGRLLASGGEDESIKVWDVNTGTLLRSIDYDGPDLLYVVSIAFRPDGKRLLTAQGVEVSLWDTSTWTRLQKFTTNESHKDAGSTTCCGSEAVYVRFSADGSRIISGHEDGTVKVWREGKAKPVRVLKTAETAETFALSPGEKLLASNTGEEPPRLWDWAASKRVATVGDDASYTHGLAFSPDGRRLATSDISGGMYVWDTKSGKPLLELDGGSSSDDALAFSPDGRLLASGGGNQNIIMWDAQTGRRLWHILPVKETYQPTPEETAAARLESQRAAEEKERAEEEVTRLAPKVFVTFDHYGEPRDPGQSRMIETGKPDKSLKKQDKSEATGVWLRIHNDSALPVKLSTESTYFTRGEECGYESAKRFYNGLCEGAEIGIRVGVLDAKGEPVPYGFDFGGVSILPPNTSALFSLPLGLFKDKRTIVVGYRFMKENASGKLEDYGEGRETKLTAALLP
ncbi:MAG TPA: WD40 repeat domain-containing protein [Pyrinomonadaceae bacterium]|jgi:WD40 repeat protein|nr:WD40 repeat domain-containing protein [Pyrinomonadaceae bacterium]